MQVDEPVTATFRALTGLGWVDAAGGTPAGGALAALRVYHYDLGARAAAPAMTYGSADLTAKWNVARFGAVRDSLRALQVCCTASGSNTTGQLGGSNSGIVTVGGVSILDRGTIKSLSSTSTNSNGACVIYESGAVQYWGSLLSKEKMKLKWDPQGEGNACLASPAKCTV